MPFKSKFPRLRELVHRQGHTADSNGSEQQPGIGSNGPKPSRPPASEVDRDSAADVKTSTEGPSHSRPEPETTSGFQRSSTAATADATADTDGTVAGTPSAKLSEKLWDQAYDGLKAGHAKLVEGYEKILSEKLREAGTDHSKDGLDQNLIAQHDVHLRRSQMQQLVHLGLSRIARESKVKEFMGKSAQAVSPAMALIDTAVKEVPQATLPWAGISAILEMFTRPITATQANREGIDYVIGRMKWYSSLASFLLKENPTESDGLDSMRSQLEYRIYDLYSELLLYQMSSVCSYFKNRFFVFSRDLLWLDDWKGEIQAIKSAETAFRHDFDMYTDQGTRSGVEQLVTIQLSEKDDQCLRDLRNTDPSIDKERIEADKGGLLADTCNWIFDNRDFQQWRYDEQTQLLWIKGDPGKGKTMLLCGIINDLKKPGPRPLHLSFFFCQATDSRINNATAVLKGLIYLIAEQQPSLLSHVRRKYDRAGKRLFEGPEAWFAVSSIFSSMLRDPLLETTYLAIDALDECASDLNRLLDFIVDNVSASPRVKWIVSSRNWSDIERRLTTTDQSRRKELSLETNSATIARAVGSYIAYKMSQLSSIQHDETLRERVYELISQKAEGTFLWAALVFKELQDIEDAEYEEEADVLKIIEEVPSGLTQLYSRMLQQIDRLKAKDPKFCRTILSTISLVYRPLHLVELAAVAGFQGHLAETAVLKRLVYKCGSLLNIRDDTVYFVHQSAQDYLMEDETARSSIFPSGQADAHRAISVQSLQVMAASGILKENMYSLSDPGTMIGDVITPESDPLASVRYSCVYWIRHICDQNDSNSNNMRQKELSDGGDLYVFFKTHFLHWLEALSLLSSITEAIIAIAGLQSLLSRQPGSQLSDLVEDMQRFILHNRWVIENAPLQIYSSALIFSPTQSLIRTAFKEEEPAWITIKGSVESNWSPCLQTLEGHDGSVWAMALSDNKSILASASADTTVRLWDVATGTHLRTLVGHSKDVRNVVFSKDNVTLASCSWDLTVRLWNVATGALLKILKGHDDWINAMVLSDKTLATASDDRTVRLWDITTGSTRRILRGHSDRVRHIAFSRDGKMLASSSYDMTVRLWYVNTGVQRQVLEGHGAAVLAVTFSDTMLASASSDNTVRLWDVTTGAHRQTLAGHSGWVEYLKFTTDGLKLATGSADETVRIWNTIDGAHQHTLKGHSCRINGMTFSQDGTTIASIVSDQTVWLWNAETGSIRQVLKGHRNNVFDITFLDNGKVLATSSADKTIKFWDTSITVHNHAPEENGEAVLSILFSPDGKMIASTSPNKIVRVWNVATGAHQYTFEGHGGWVKALAFSNDSKILASASEDKTVRLWDVVAGFHRQTLTGHTKDVLAVAFSGDCKTVATGSADETVRLYETATGIHRQTIEAGSVIWHLSFSVDGQHLKTNKARLAIDPALSSVTPELPLQTSCLSVKHGWVMRNNQRLLWLHPDFRGRTTASSGNSIALGQEHGRVRIIQIDSPKD